MKNRITNLFVGTAIAFICFVGCIPSAPIPRPELTLEDKVKLIDQFSLYAYLRDHPDETEENFWEIAEAIYPSVTFHDIYYKAVNKGYVLVRGIVADSPKATIDDYKEEYTLKLIFEVDDNIYGSFDEPIDLKYADSPGRGLSYGSDTLKCVKRDDVVELCCTPESLFGFYKTGIIAIRKVDHQDGVVTEIVLADQARREEEAKKKAATKSSSTNTQAPQRAIENYIWARVSSKYDGTTIDEVRINEDLGTDTEGDYIALVNLTWNVQNSAETTEKMLQMYSDDLAASLAIDHPEVQEAAIFWNVPYLGSNTSKWSYERRGDGMYATDKVLGF